VTDCCVGWGLVAWIKCAEGCVLCGVRWFVFLLWQVKLLSWEGAWCGGVVVLDTCVCYGWRLHIACGLMYVQNGYRWWVGGCYVEVVCAYVGQCVRGLFRIEMYILWCAGWCLRKPGSRPCALCKRCYSTSSVIRGVGKGQWLVGVVGSAHPGIFSEIKFSSLWRNCMKNCS
jgi:hypothetical protein